MTAKNPLNKIPVHPGFNIPIFLSDDQKASYISQVRQHFIKLRKYMQSINKIFYRPAIKENIIERITGIQEVLIKVIEQYLEGHPYRAYILFRDVMDEYGIREEIISLQQYKIARGSTLYRIQRQFTEPPLKYRNTTGFLNAKHPNDLFHPPFQKRRTVSTNRFSISGYPCLYLSETLTTSYSECFPHKHEYGPYNAIGLSNTRPLYFIDLSNENLFDDETRFPGLMPLTKTKRKDPSKILDHLGVYQIVMASHMKVNYIPTYPNERFYFKAEYIIPQILLQWLKIEGLAVDGIRYSSCTGHIRFPNGKRHYNYVMPVQSIFDKGFCPILARLFQFSPVYNHFVNSKPKLLRSEISRITQMLKKSPKNSLRN
jgi:hypothetical protein